MVDSWIRIPIMKSKTNTGKLDTGFRVRSQAGLERGRNRPTTGGGVIKASVKSWCKTNCTFVLNFAV